VGCSCIFLCAWSLGGKSPNLVLILKGLYVDLDDDMDLLMSEKEQLSSEDIVEL
jgi:hypothetical protein